MTTLQEAEVIRCRPFTIVDGMIFVAGAAAYLALTRGYLAIAPLWFRGVPFDKLDGFQAWRDYLAKNPQVIVGTLFFGFWFLILLVLVLSAVFVSVRLRGPRPPLRRLAAQPGLAALLALAGGIGFGILVGACGEALGLKLPGVVANVYLSSVIPLAWVWLAVKGRWRSEPGWIEGLGRFVAVLWAVLIPTFLGLAWGVTN